MSCLGGACSVNSSKNPKVKIGNKFSNAVLEYINTNSYKIHYNGKVKKYNGKIPKNGIINLTQNMESESNFAPVSSSNNINARAGGIGKANRESPKTNAKLLQELNELIKLNQLAIKGNSRLNNNSNIINVKKNGKIVKAKLLNIYVNSEIIKVQYNNGTEENISFKNILIPNEEQKEFKNSLHSNYTEVNGIQTTNSQAQNIKKTPNNFSETNKKTIKVKINIIISNLLLSTANLNSINAKKQELIQFILSKNISEERKNKIIEAINKIFQRLNISNQRSKMSVINLLNKLAEKLTS